MFLSGPGSLKLTVILVILTLFLIVPVSGAFASNSWALDRHMLITDPSDHAGTLVVGPEDEGKTIESAYGATIHVVLPDAGPGKKWKYIDSDNAPLAGYNVIPGTPPGHQFTLKINALGPVRFTLVDVNDGTVLKEFKFYLSLKMPLGGR